jgi:predicted peroxiredoxin
MSTVAIVCNSSDPSSLYPAFVLGSASAALGDDVVMYFAPGAAPALRPGVLEAMEEKGMPPMKELVEGIMALDGKMFLCELALEALDMTKEDFRDDLHIGGATSFLASIRDANITFSF